jgi:microcompartment protein CcmL/EutN
MYQAIGVIELKSIAKGIEATDAALKSAGINLISARPACPGKYEIILTGTISNVVSAVEHVKGRYDEKLVDSSIMGRIDPQVITALFGTVPAEKKGSLGIIETYSAASIIKAADIAVKTAKVSILSFAPLAVWAVRAFASSPVTLVTLPRLLKQAQSTRRMQAFITVRPLSRLLTRLFGSKYKDERSLLKKLCKTSPIFNIFYLIFPNIILLAKIPF